MDIEKVDLFLLTNSKYLPECEVLNIRKKMLMLKDEDWVRISTFSFKDPLLAFLLSFFCGYLAIDRFYIGDVALGLLKLITFGGLHIWVIVDWFRIMKVTRMNNSKRLQDILYNLINSK